MRPHRVVVLDVLTKHPPQMPFVDGDDVIEALAPERPDHPLGDGVGVRCAHRSQNRLDPDPSSACDEVPAIATVAVSDEEPAPNANAVAERVIGTLRRECLDHVIIFSDQHLRHVLGEYVKHYNALRPHRTLGLDSPDGREPRPRPSESAYVRRREVLGGLINEYGWAA